MTGAVPGAQNIGWLAVGHPFDTEQPAEGDLELIWAHCKVAVHETRGLHACDLCSDWRPDDHLTTRDGERLMLGYSEIRVIGPSGQSFAAPSLIYHYVCVHHYRPPDAFLTALRSGLTPSSEAYFDALRTRAVTWGSTVRS